ncbi:DNA helicase [Tanacetum coccineum]
MSHEASRWQGQGKKVSMNEYYKYQLHPQVKEFRLIFKGGRLFQQYVVTVFCAVEQSHLGYIHKHQSDLRSNYLSGLYDDIGRGDREGMTAGSKIMLPVKWLEIKRHLSQYQELTPNDRADIVFRVFEQKVKDFVRFLKVVRTFGYVIASIVC